MTDPAMRSTPDNDDTVALRRAHPSDIPVFIRMQSDREAAFLAAFGGRRDPAENAAHWAGILRSPGSETWTILSGGVPVGYISMFEVGPDREITYWVDRAVWGRGIAAAALHSFLGHVSHRPLLARVAADNVRSIRVLERCGFRRGGTELSFAEQRDEEIEEFIYRLD